MRPPQDGRTPGGFRARARNAEGVPLAPCSVHVTRLDCPECRGLPDLHVRILRIASEIAAMARECAVPLGNLHQRSACDMKRARVQVAVVERWMGSPEPAAAVVRRNL